MLTEPLNGEILLPRMKVGEYGFRAELQWVKNTKGRKVKIQVPDLRKEPLASEFTFLDRSTLR